MNNWDNSIHWLHGNSWVMLSVCVKRIGMCDGGWVVSNLLVRGERGGSLSIVAEMSRKYRGNVAVTAAVCVC